MKVVFWETNRKRQQNSSRSRLLPGIRDLNLDLSQARSRSLDDSAKHVVTFFKFSLFTKSVQNYSLVHVRQRGPGGGFGYVLIWTWMSFSSVNGQEVGNCESTSVTLWRKINRLWAEHESHTGKQYLWEVWVEEDWGVTQWSTSVDSWPPDWFIKLQLFDI